MRVIVVGSGRVGAALALELGQRGHSVCVIDPDADAFYRLGAGFRGRTIEGLGFDRETLVRAGVEHTDALAACTSNDNTNMVITRLARDVFRVPTVVARLYDPGRQLLYQHLNIPTVCTSKWGAEQLLSLICHPRWKVVGSLGDGHVQVVQASVGPALVGRSVSSLSQEHGVVVVGLARGSRTFLAQPDEVLEAGDLLYLAVDASAQESILEQLSAGGKEVHA